MATTPVTFNTFGGLDVKSDPIDVGATRALALNNVDLLVPGQLPTRPGWARWSQSHTATAVNIERILWAPGMGSSPTTHDYVLAYGNTSLYRLDEAGNVSGAATVNAGMWAWTKFGTDTASRVYMASGNGLQYADSSLTITTVSSAVTARFFFLAVSPVSNRIVGAGDSNASTYAHRVSFSDPGQHNVDHASRFVDLHPGDGEGITGMATWRDYLFVFKRTRHYIFFGEGTDSSGQPIFNYRTVHNYGHVSRVFAQDEILSAPEGVYFVDTDGIYLTNGDGPRRVSAALDPYFQDTASRLQITKAVAYADRRLFVASSGSTYVYYPASDQWSIWDIPLAAMTYVDTPASPSASGYLLFVRSSSDLTHIQKVTGSTDNGSAIAWSWKSGKYDLGYPGQVKVILESEVTGSGTVTMKLATWDAPSSSSGTLDAGQSITLGTAPDTAQGWRTLDVEGRLVQHELSGSGPATVNRITHHVSHLMPSGVG